MLAKKTNKKSSKKKSPKKKNTKSEKNSQKSKDKKTKNENEAKDKKEEQEHTKSSKPELGPEVFKIKFANEEVSDITQYDPSTRCAAIKDVNGKRDFSLNKGGNNDDGGGNLGEYTGGLDVSGIKNENARKIAEYLLEKDVDGNGGHFNRAQISGILGNIKIESGFDPSSDANDVDGKPSSGICQWHLGRRTKMIKACGTNWKTNLEGQVNYLWKELTSKSYKTSVLGAILKKNKDTVENMNSVCEIWDQKFEVSDGKAIDKRKKAAKEIYDQIKVLDGFTGSGPKHNLTAEQVKRLVAGCIQENGGGQKAIQAEASLMCNLAESSRGNKYGNNVYRYVNRYGGWFGKATINKIQGSAWKSVSEDQYNWGNQIFNGGLRTVPKYIDEHDWWTHDISWVKYGGPSDSKTYSGLSKSKLIPGKSIIHNKFGSTYTFWMFFQPNNGGDPYGSTYEPKRY